MVNYFCPPALVAYCILESGNKSTSTEICAACCDLLPKRTVPDKLSIVESFPLLPNGKIDRQQLIKVASSWLKNNT